MEHFEINASDFETAVNFYRELFGWDIKLMPEFNYALIETGSSPNGGIAVRSGELPNNSTVYITVEDMEGTLANVVEAGGTITQPKTIITEEWGYTAEFLDPDGVFIGLWSKD
jgi:predicted enzyme related to lactoylglutathione lyase